MIKDHLVRGISDLEILADIPVDPQPNRTLEDLVDLITQKEQGKATRTAVSDCVSGMASRKSPERSKPIVHQKNFQGKCWACGGQSHGARNDRATREKRCPAWNNICNKCQIRGHYNKSVCPATHGDTGTTSQNSARGEKVKHTHWRMNIKRWINWLRWNSHQLNITSMMANGSRALQNRTQWS